MNNHHRGITPEVFINSNKLSNYWYISSTNIDPYTNRSFVSSIEPINPNLFPVYGIQYHPEKNTFEYNTYKGSNIPYETINHSIQGITMSLSLSQFFVNLTKTNMYLQDQNQKQKQRNKSSRNPHRRRKHHEYTKFDKYPLIYTYPIQLGVNFEQIYLIPKASNTSNQSSSSVTTTTSTTKR